MGRNRQREHRHSRESGAAPQHAQGIAEVLRAVLQQANAPGVAAFFADLTRSAEIEPQTSGCFIRGQTRLAVFLDLMLLVKAQLRVEIGFEGAAAE